VRQRMDKDWDRNRRFYLYEKVKGMYCMYRIGDQSKMAMIRCCCWHMILLTSCSRVRGG
jgi:hypothetical protein